MKQDQLKQILETRGKAVAITIREMLAVDYEAVYALWEAADGVGVDASDSREGILRYLERNPGLSHVAEDGQNLVAAVLCGYDGRRGYLSHLAVADSHREQGLGRQLADLCLEKLADLGITRCNLRIFTDNQDGRAFWERVGWRVRHDLQVMCKETSFAPPDTA